MCSYADCLIWVRALFVINYSNCNSLAATRRRGQFNVPVWVCARASAHITCNIQQISSLFFSSTSLYAWENNKKKNERNAIQCYSTDRSDREEHAAVVCFTHWCDASTLKLHTKTSTTINNDVEHQHFIPFEMFAVFLSYSPFSSSSVLSSLVGVRISSENTYTSN